MGCWHRFHNSLAWEKNFPAIGSVLICFSLSLAHKAGQVVTRANHSILSGQADAYPNLNGKELSMRETAYCSMTPHPILVPEFPEGCVL